jgi:hypothetical protein
MAGAGAKKRAEENTRRLKTLRVIIAVALATFVGVRLVLGRASAEWYQYAALAATVVVYMVTYSSIRFVATPVYNAQGELEDAGADLNKGGVQSYQHDVLYVTAFVQLLASFWARAWLLWLVVPAYAGYQLFAKVIYPTFIAAKPEVELDEATRRQLERAAARSERRRQKRM